MQFAVMKAANRDGVLITDLAAKRARLSKAEMMGFCRASAADEAGLRGDELAVLLVSQANGLGRNARRRAPAAVPRKTIGDLLVFSLWSRKGISRDAKMSSPGAACNCCSSIAEADLIAESLSRKFSSRRSASAASSVFLRGRFRCTHSAASSADSSWATSMINCSRNAADCCASNVGRAGRAAFSPRPMSRRRAGPSLSYLRRLR